MSLDVPAAQLVALLLATARAAAWLLVVPGFGSRAVPAPAKVALALALSVPCLPRLVPHAPDATTPALIAGVVVQVAVGTALGFLVSLVFSAVQAAGDLIDVSSGFSLAYAFDPLNLQGGSVFGRLHQMLAVTLLFATNLHVVVLQGFLRSFDALPLDASLSLDTMGRLLTDGIARFFLSALEIAAPLLVVLFLADLGLALLTKVAPSLNAFSTGFPVKMLAALLLVAMTFPMLPDVVRGLVDTGNGYVLTLLGG